MLLRYVNMGSSAGGDGTTNNTAGATRAWASLSEAMTAFHNTDPGDEVLLTVTRGAGGKDTTGINQPNVTTSAARPFRIVASAADYATALWSTSKYILEVTNAHCFYNNVINYLQISGLQIHLIENNGSSYEAVKLTNANQHATNVYNLVERCYVRCTKTTGQHIGIDLGGIDVKTRLGIARNCVVENFRSGCVGVGALSKFANLTAAKNAFSFVEDADPMVVMNCISTAVTSGPDYAGTGHASCKNNADDSGNGMPGANPRTGAFSFQAPNGNDFTLLTGDATAKGFGFTNPLVGVTGEFTDDIRGYTRVAPWDIGAFQVNGTAPSSGSGPLWTGAQAHRRRTR